MRGLPNVKEGKGKGISSLELVNHSRHMPGAENGRN